MGSVNQVYDERDERWLSDNACLWRYVPLRTLTFYLTGNIFIPAIETLRRDDPFEGKFHFDVIWFNTVMDERYGERLNEIEGWIYRELCTDAEKKSIEINKNYPNHAARIFEQYFFNFLRRTRYAWCWFLSEAESAAMWNIYGKHGVAISSTTKKLSGVLSKSKWDFEVGRMRYIRLIAGEAHDYDFIPEKAEDASFLLKPHFLKRKEYESEKEVRFVTAAPERGPNSGISLDEILPSEWIQEIRLWPGLKPAEEKSLKEVVDHFAPGIPCARSDLFGADPWSDGIGSHFGAEMDKVDWNSWKDGSDSIPAELKQL